MRSFRTIYTLLATILFCHIGTSSAAAVVKLNFFNSQTGIRIDSGNISTHSLENNNHFESTFENGSWEHFFYTDSYEFEIHVDGYNPISKRQTIDHEEITLDFYLDQNTSEPRLNPNYIINSHLPNKMFVSGFISDERGIPLSDVKVSIGKGDLLTTSGVDGYFQLYLIYTQNFVAGQGLETLIFSKNGYNIHKKIDVPIWPNNDLQFRITLEKGNSVFTEKEFNYSEIQLQRMSIDKSVYQKRLSLYADEQNKRPGVISCTPTSITVGLSSTGGQCGTSTCTSYPPCSASHSQVLSIQTYVKGVIPNEWLPGWSNLPNISEAYKAGAVAIRTYAIFFVLHPLSSPTYDICSSPCCQVYSSTTNASTSLAVDQTAGWILWDWTEEAYSQYSSENNNLSGNHCSAGNVVANGCGDGSFGRSSTGSPCFTDLPGTGYIQFGHGKGMSQVGSARWASGLDLGSWCQGSIYGTGSPSHGYGTKNWQQILDHYYSYYQLYDCGSTTTCSDTYEPNNSYQNSYDLTPTPFYLSNQTLNFQSYISTSNDLDWYVIYFNDAGELTVNLSSLPADYDMEIYNAGGLSSANWLDSGEEPGTANEEIIYCQSQAVSTWIYLTVYSKNGAFDDCDSYDLQLTWIPGAAACSTPCAPPTNLTESSITKTSATVSWSSASGAQGYEVQYMSGGNWSSTQSVPVTSKSLTGLTCGENYQWRVRTVCAGSSYSSWVTNSFSTSGCGPVGCPAPNDNCNSAETITVNGSCKNGDVCSATESLAPSSSCNTPGTPASNYARDVWYVFNASQTGSYTFTVNPGDSLDAVLEVRTAACGGTSIDCADSGGGRGGSETLTIPSLSAGTYYIRIYHYTVAGLFAGSQTDFQLCVTGPSPNNCDDPTNLAASNPTQEEIDLEWDDVVPPGSYEIEYREQGASNWQTENSSNSRETINNLQCNTTYEWRVRTDCGSGYSSWVSGQTFTTDTCCPNVSLNNVSGSNAACIGTTETYSVNLDPSYTYTWLLASGGTIASGHNTETVQVNWTSAGQHIIEVTADNGCDNETEDLSILVEAIGAPTVQIPSPLQACANDPLTITATYTLGGTTPSFNWYINGNLEVGNNSSQTFTNIAAGDIVTVEMNSSSSCATPSVATSNSAAVQIVTAQPVSLSISAPTTQLCTGGSVTLTATSTAAGGAPTYNWLVNGNSVGSGSSYALNNVTSNTSVVCELTSSLGCVTGNPATSNTVNITVNNPVTPSITIAVPNDTICTSDVVTVTATVQNGGSAPTLTWAVNGNTVGSCQNQTTCALSNLTNGDNVTCSLTSSDTCVTVPSATSNGIAFIVKQAPNLVASASANAVCPGDTLLLFANGATNYSWTGTNSFSSNTANTIDYPTTTTSYTILAEANGCDTTSTFTVDMKFVPTTTAVPSDTTICIGDNALLQLESPTLNWYQWGPAGAGLSSTSGNTTASTYTNSNTASPDTTTTYYIYVGYQNGCHTNDSILVTVVDTPNVPLLDTVGGLTVLNPPSGNATYYWYLDGQPIDTTTVPYLISGPGGNYQVIVQVNNLCHSSFSNTVSFVGLHVLNGSEASIIAYPNPNNGRFTIELKGLVNTGQLEVLNALGQNIGLYPIDYSNQTIEMDLSTHPAGIYLLHFSSLGFQKVIKIIKE